MDEQTNIFHLQGKPTSITGLLSALSQCAGHKALVRGRKLHALAISSGLASVAIIGNHLMQMFLSCGGTLLEANLAFCCLSEPSSRSWHAIMSGHTVMGENKATLRIFYEMQAQNVNPSDHVFSCALKACCNIRKIEQGRLIHDIIIRFQADANLVLRGGLIVMYVECNSLDEARCIFDESPHCNIILWSTLIAGYAEHGSVNVALQLLEKMQTQGIVPDRPLFLSVIKACGSRGAIRHGKLIHELIINIGLDIDVAIGSSLLDMYGTCGYLAEAQKLFDQLTAPNVISWGALIAGYAQHGQGCISLSLFHELLKQGMHPDNFIYSSILKACCSVGAMYEGRYVHDLMIRNRVELDLNMGSVLLDLYAKWGSLEEAVNVFRTLPYTNVVTWNVMIAGYAENGRSLSALVLLGKMLHKGMIPDKVTFIFTLKACVCEELLDYGRLVHKELIVRSIESDDEVRTSLIHMYSKCGSLRDSQNVFDGHDNKDSVLFAALMSGYAQHGHSHYAFKLLESMQQAGFDLNRVALSSVLKTCTVAKQGKRMHEQIIKDGLESDVIVASAVVNMYAKTGLLDEAQKTVTEMSLQSIVPWNSIIAGYTHNGNALAAVQCFAKMQEKSLHADKVTYLSLLRACSNLGTLTLGEILHYEITVNGFGSDIDVATSLVNMYGKCGSFDSANRVFRDPKTRSIASWNSLITSYVQYSKHDCALECISQCQEQGLNAEERMTSTIISAFSRIGKFRDEKQYFEVMYESNGIRPSTENINVLADLLCRTGCLSEAEEFLCSLSCPFNLVGLTSLLSACKTYGNIELGRKFFRRTIMSINGMITGNDGLLNQEGPIKLLPMQVEDLAIDVVFSAEEAVFLELEIQGL